MEVNFFLLYNQNKKHINVLKQFFKLISFLINCFLTYFLIGFKILTHK